MKQKIFDTMGEKIEALNEIIKSLNVTKAMLVCDGSLKFLPFYEDLSTLSVPYVIFDKFTPNPLYEQVCAGVDMFKAENCDIIIAIGGGSAIDVAKCIKLFSNMNPSDNYLNQIIVPSNIPLVAVPTTAGTGSESTRYSVIYYEGEKQSITDNSIIPEYVILEKDVLLSLPEYQRKATMLDALCHSIESYWSLNSTEESKEYSRIALQTIVKYKEDYLLNKPEGNKQMLLASNYAGKAINITATTAAHAMSYKLTSKYGVSHGHAVALCISKLWKYMLDNIDKTIDPRGEEYLREIFGQISYCLTGATDIYEGLKFFDELYASLDLKTPTVEDENDFDILASSVNTVRLKNNPLPLDNKVLIDLYKNILHTKN